LVARAIRVIILKQNLDINQHDMNSKIMITLFSLFAELERDLISLRTKEALASDQGARRLLLSFHLDGLLPLQVVGMVSWRIPQSGRLE
jgi:DNA invertase Pin-like site-specific DNA recombinase